MNGRRTFRQEPEDAYLRQEYKLDQWIEKPRERPRKYYKAIDDFRGLFARSVGVDPQDDGVVRGMELVVESDDSFDDFLNRRHGDPKLAEKDFRSQLRRAAAGMILDHYYEACRAGSWPDA